MAMAKIQDRGTVGLTGVAALALAIVGCHSTPVDTSSYAQGPAPLRMPSPAANVCVSYEDSLTGGQIFSMYCGYCHNARSLAERPFSNYQNVAAHMRGRANLTGEEYAKLMAWLRRWHDVPPPHEADRTVAEAILLFAADLGTPAARPGGRRTRDAASPRTNLPAAMPRPELGPDGGTP